MYTFSAVSDIVHGNIYYQQYFTNVVVDYEALFSTSASWLREEKSEVLK